VEQRSSNKVVPVLQNFFDEEHSFPFSWSAAHKHSPVLFSIVPSLFAHHVGAPHRALLPFAFDSLHQLFASQLGPFTPHLHASAFFFSPSVYVHWLFGKGVLLHRVPLSPDALHSLFSAHFTRPAS
jgi:hypothetical protein